MGYDHGIDQYVHGKRCEAQQTPRKCCMTLSNLFKLTTFVLYIKFSNKRKELHAGLQEHPAIPRHWASASAPHRTLQSRA